MKGRPRELQKQIAIRISPQLHAALRRDAAANGRTLAQTVRFHLEVSLERPARAGLLARLLAFDDADEIVGPAPLFDLIEEIRVAIQGESR